MPRKQHAVLGLGLLTILAALTAAACSDIPDPARYTYLFQPSYAQFTSGAAPLAASPCTASGSVGVHTFLENQCGTLDCHGQTGRPFRLFSVNGLRAESDAGLSRFAPLTADELYANYLSAVGLEPEEMSRVVVGDDSPTALLIVKKPRLIEHHKGGKKMSQGDPEDTCLTSWLADPAHFEGVSFDSACCDEAGQVP
jgi:hypothetical protein